MQRSKRVFWREDFGVMRSTDMLGQRTVDQFGLEPLLSVGIMYGNLPASFIQYYRSGSPISISDLLLQFWAPDTRFDRYSISGIPELLVIDRRLRGALHDEFFQWLQQLCQWRWSDEHPNTKQYAAQIRCLQSFPHIFIHDSDVTLERLEVAELNKHQRPLSFQLDFSSAPPKHRASLAELSGTGRIVPSGLSGLGPDVDTTGQTFFCYSSQNDTELDEIFWSKGDLHNFGWLEASKSPVSIYEYRENECMQEEIATLMLMDGSSSRIAKHFDLSVSALRRKILGDLELKSKFNCELRSLLGINLLADDSGFVPLSGLLLSIDEKCPLRKAARVWDSITFHGDYASMEILPDGDEHRDPEWRYIVPLDDEIPVLLRIATQVSLRGISAFPAIRTSPAQINRALFDRLIDLFNHPDEPETNAVAIKFLWPILLCDIERRSTASSPDPEASAYHWPKS
jgi:hypothetical protein